MAAAYALAGLVEWVVVGMVIGFVYHPVAKVRAARSRGMIEAYDHGRHA